MAILAKASLFASLSIYTPLSSLSSDVYPLPPPTTLLGALAYPYNRYSSELRENIDGCSTATKIFKSIIYAAAGSYKPYTVTRTIERVYQHPYLRKDHWNKLGMAYSIAVRPIAIARELYILYIVRDDDADMLKRFVYGITRLGRKESLVAIDEVDIKPIHRIATHGRRACSTRFYFPKRIAVEIPPQGRGDLMVLDMPIIARENFCKGTTPVTERFIVPSPFTESAIDIELNEYGVILRMEFDGRILEIPVPKDVVGG